MSEENVENEYKVYTERWFILLATATLIWSNIMVIAIAAAEIWQSRSEQWVAFSAQIDQTNMFFCGPDGFSDCTAAFLSNQIYQIVAVIVSIIGMYFATVFGTLPTLRLAAVFNIVGSAIRLVSSIPSLQNFVIRQTLMLIGTSVSAAAQMYFVVFSKIAESWFFPMHRASANVACSNSRSHAIMQIEQEFIGLELGVRRHRNSWSFFFMNSIVSVFCLLPLFLLFVLCRRSVPKTPPSASSQHESNISVTSGILKCFKDPQFLVQIVVYSINFAIANGLIYTSNAINYQGYNLKGYPIAIATLVCMFSAYFVGVIADRTRKFRAIALINVCVIAVSVLFLRLYLIKAYSGWYDSVIVCTLLSIIMSCCAIHIPIGNEMGVETTYPVQESISTGVLNTFGQTWLFSLYFILYALQDSHWIYKSSGKGGSWQLSLDFWVAVSVLNAFIALLFLKPRYNRLQMEEEAKATEESIRESAITISLFIPHLRMFPSSFLIYPLFLTIVLAQFPNNDSIVHHDGRLWDVVIETCDKDGAGTDAAAYLKIFYESGHDSETFHLDNPGRNDFEQGSRDHFKIFFKQSDIVNMGLFWWPGFSLSQSWCVNWVLLLNSDTEACFEGIFDKWILHYRDPPTYATKFHRLRYADCVRPGPSSAERRSYLRYDDIVRNSGGTAADDKNDDDE
ncbi:unnamed protein product [Caenorhabditis sp. 36 PRJEB53466]|nr:unnamed protein product [Caenorhabditis sp. 36 PRJEB53466]